LKEFRPGLYPKALSPQAATPSERRVYDAIKDSLPAGWSGWHSLKLRTGAADFSEIDFVLAAPDPAILILEVKGGNIKKENGVWTQNGWPMKEAPLSQAHRNMNALLAKFAGNKLAPPPIGKGVVFPDTVFDEQPTQGDLQGLVLGSRELPYLAEVLPDFLKSAVPSGIRRRPSPGWKELLHSWWCESWPESPKLSCLVKDREAERVRLGDEQFQILQGVFDNDVVLVRGGAGTGKTLLAGELARKEARAGRSVLLLTFTEALGQELARNLAMPQVTVSPVGRFALQHLRRRGFDEPERYEPEFWDKITKRAAKSRSLWKGDSWDTVIVDEGQDFGKYEWDIVNRCSKKGKRMWIFADEGQAFWDKRGVPPSIQKRCTRFDLAQPYRCPTGIQALADAYLGKSSDYEAIKSALENGTIKIVLSDNGEAGYCNEVAREIDILCKQGFRDNEIAVISLRGRMFPGNIMHRKELGGRPLAQATDTGCEERMICDTFLRYKGLERPVIIITDLTNTVTKYNVRMNIAVSRALGALRIMVPKNILKDDEILSRIFMGQIPGMPDAK
jgi:hypothetical protein